MTHDRYFLDNVAGWILELDRGRGIPVGGQLLVVARAEAEPAGAGGEGRRRKRQQTLAARARVDPHVAARAPGQGQGAPERVRGPAARKTARRRSRRPKSTSRPGPRLGDVVVEARGLRKGYGDNLLIDDLDFTLPRGGIVGVIGPNGAGKTTLFRMITGAEKPDARHAADRRDRDRSATSIRAATRSTRTRRVWEEISGGSEEIELGKRKIAVARLRVVVQLQGRRRSSARSGRCRAASATACTWPSCCKKGSNLLLLDEPTNDLDVDTLRALEEALLSFAGCAVVISHDRWFLDRIATHMLAFEGDSQVVWFEGNYQDYEADRKRRLGAEADQPHRIKYRKLTTNLNQLRT